MFRAKRIIAGLLVLVLMVGMLPLSAFATEAEKEPQATVDSNNLTVEGTNGFGNLLSEEITESQEEAEEEASVYEAGYSVTDLVIEGSTATVTYDSLEEALLVVALYTEDGLQMITSATATVTAEETETSVTFEGDMPDYFLASAYLMDTYDLSPLCASYDTPMYTQEMQELLASTINDYDADRVLNLDDDETTNFAVYAEGTILIEEQKGVNTVTSVDDETATYVIENADDSITGLQAGDVFAYPYGENEILIVKVACITIDGTTATITGDELEMEEVFRAVKLDGTSGTADITVDDSTAGEGITYIGLEESAGSDVQTYAIEGGDTTTISHKFELEIKTKESTDQTSAALAVSGSLNIEMGVSVKYYISATTKYVEFKITPSTTFTLTVNESVTLSDKLGYLAVSPVPGVYVGFEPEIQLKFNVKTSLNVTLDSTIGFKYDTGSGVQNISKSPDIDVKITIDGTIFVGIDFCPKVAILDDSISKIEVNMLVGAEIKASTSGYAYEAYEKDSDSYHQCRECIAMTIQFKASLGGTLQFLSQDWLTVKITIGEWKVPLGEMYYSVDNDEFDIGKCPNLTYRVTIEVKDKDNNPIPNQDVTVSTLGEPLVTNENGVTVFYSRAETIKVRAEKDGCFNADVVPINSAKKIALRLTRTTSSAGGGGGSDDTDDWRYGIDFGGILGTIDSEEITDRSVVASGECGAEGDNITWTLYQNGLLKLSGSGKMADYSPWNDLRSQVNQVIIQEGITTIGKCSFAFSENLTTVTIPDSITTIESEAFRDCIALNNVVIPGSVQSFGSGVFLGCTGLKNVTLEEGITAVGSQMFSHCGLEAISLPCSVVLIDYGAFSGCLELQSVYLNDGLVEIDRSAFSGCEALSYITIPKSIVNIGGDAFSGCESLYSITIPEGVEELNDYTFSSCGSLSDVNLPNSLKRIGQRTFSGCSISSIALPNQLEKIDNYAFIYCKKLTTITIPASVTSIGSDSFRDSGLQKITFLGDAPSISSAAFREIESTVVAYYPTGNETWNDTISKEYSAVNIVWVPYALDEDGNMIVEETAVGGESPCGAVEIAEEISSVEMGKTPSNETEAVFAEVVDSQEAPTVDQVYGGDYSTEVTETYTLKTASFTGLVSGEQYVLLAMVSIEVENPLAPDNLLYIDQAEALEDGTLRFQYVQRVPADTSYVVACGASNKNLKDAEIIFPEMTADGELQVVNPIVIYDRKTLIEGADYTILGTVDFTEAGEYTCYIRGIHNYTGLVECAYTVEASGTEVASGYSGYTTWVLMSDGTLTFSGEGAMKNYTYKSEMPWYDYLDQITSVVIEEGVTSIGSYAFYGMPNLTSIIIPEGVTAIGEYAFKNCTALDNVILPSALTKIGESAFFGCISLSEITIPEGIYTVWAYTFKNCTSLASVSLPSTLIKIDEAAFYGCSALTELTIPDSVSVIGIYCFKNCTSLESVQLPAKLTEVREAAFYGTALTSLEIPEGVTKIGPYTFKNCTSLATLNLPESLTSIGEAAFYGSAVQELNIPDAVTSIGSYAFKNCTNLASVQLPANLKTVSEAAFYNCSSLTTLVIPDSVTSIGNYAFRNCTELTSVTFGSGLTTIGESSFYGSSRLTSLEIPEGVTSIGAYTFKSCTGLTSVSLPSTLETIGDSAFYGCTGLTEITIPTNLTSVGAYAFSRCTALKAVTFTGNAPTIGEGAFSKVVATVYYPADNVTWTDDVKQNYGGTLTWTMA